MKRATSKSYLVITFTLGAFLSVLTQACLATESNFVLNQLPTLQYKQQLDKHRQFAEGRQQAPVMQTQPPLLPQASLLLQPPLLADAQELIDSSQEHFHVSPNQPSVIEPEIVEQLSARLLAQPSVIVPEITEQPPVIAPEVIEQPSQSSAQLLAQSSVITPEVIEQPLQPSASPLQPSVVAPEVIEQPPTQPSAQPTEQPQNNLPTPEQIILETLTSTAERYPYIVNPTDTLTFSPQSFNPNEDENYVNFDVRFAEGNPVLNQFAIAHFPQSDQFYWMLEGNRVVAETQGWQGGAFYQGQSTETHITEEVTLRQVLWGTQAVWTLPRNFTTLAGNARAQDFSVTAISGEVVNPQGTPAGRVILNSGIDLNAPNVTRIDDLIPNLGGASSYSPRGGADLFQSLEDHEAPLILQGFPTVDLSPLIDNGNVSIRPGEVIPHEVLQRTGISWGDILTGEPAIFTAPITSTPGVKVARLGRFENTDLLSVLVDPTLDGLGRDQAYLNSLFWTSLGRRTPEFELLSQEQTQENWYRAYITRPHNRSLIEYDPEEIRATYTNVFANPGISAVFALGDRLDTTQSLHATLGLLVGGLFEAVDLNNLDSSLAEARQALESGAAFTPLNTQATSAQRRQINQRLNQTLAYATFTSGLSQVSGRLTFPGTITPNSSNLFQIQTGLHRRSVHFLQQERTLTEGDTFISNMRFSSEDFGPLTFIGTPMPSASRSPSTANQSFAIDVILTAPDGQQFVQQTNSADMGTVPLPIRGSDLAFNRIELTRLDQLDTELDVFRGYLYLPAIELTLAGSIGDLNYSLTAGSWLNLDADEAPGVEENVLGIAEPSIGAYANALLNLSTTDIELDANTAPISIDTYGPLLRLNWDSTDTFFSALNYSYSHQARNLGYSITSGLAFVSDTGKTDWIGFFNGSLRIASGLEFESGLELNSETFWNISALQRVSPQLSVGGYIQNFSFSNNGLEERNLNLNYGALLRYNMNAISTSIEARIGMGEQGFDLRMEGEFRF